MPRGGGPGLEVHSIHPVEPKNKRLKDSFNKDAEHKEENGEISEVSIEGSEKRRIEQERRQEKPAIANAELRRRSEMKNVTVHVLKSRRSTLRKKLRL